MSAEPGSVHEDDLSVPDSERLFRMVNDGYGVVSITAGQARQEAPGDSRPSRPRFLARCSR